MSDAPILTADFVRTILHYDPETGVFTWKERIDARPQWNGRYAGRIAGYDWRATPNIVYRCIRILDFPFYAHRIGWLYMTGTWPTCEIDHKDTDGLNNKWSNLRPATKMQNAGNTHICPRNKTGFKGVSAASHCNKFRANIKIAGRQTHLGHFDTAEEAHAAYVDAAKKKYGEFARFK